MPGHCRRRARRQGCFYVGAGDQGIMFGTSVMRLRSPCQLVWGRSGTNGRKNGDLWWLRPRACRECTSARMMLTSMRAAKTSCSGARVSVCQSNQYKLARPRKKGTGQWKKGQQGRHGQIPPQQLRCSSSPHLPVSPQWIPAHYLTRPQQVNLFF